MLCKSLFLLVRTTLILLKVVLKTFKRRLLVHSFDGIFRFLNRFFKAFLINWSKNLRAQFGLSRKRAGVWTPWIPTSPSQMHTCLKNLQINRKRADTVLISAHLSLSLKMLKRRCNTFGTWSSPSTKLQPFEETRQKLRKPSCFNLSSGFDFLLFDFHLPNFLISLIN